ncbi:MAG: hypothetical protein KF880_07510 [Ferruginibacter sp.]|nr:hypothetical protein [Ferruginibacter sp.]
MHSKSKQELMAEWEWNAKSEEMTNRYKLSEFLSCIKQIKNQIKRTVHIEKSVKSLEDFIDALKLQQSIGVSPTLYLPDKNIELSSEHNDYQHYEMLLTLLKKNLNTNRKQKTAKQIAIAKILCGDFVGEDKVKEVLESYGRNSVRNYKNQQEEALERTAKTSYPKEASFKECLIDYLNVFDVLTEDFNLTPEQLRVVLDKWSTKITNILTNPTNKEHKEKYKELVNRVHTKTLPLQNKQGTA